MRGLRALGSPAQGAELAREAEMVMAFHAARTSTEPVRGTSAPRLLARAAIAVAAIGSLGTGGLALAAGHLPGLPGPASSHVRVAVDSSAPETDAPETQAPETQATETEAPDTEAPDTETPDTETPDTQAPDTQAPDTGASSPTPSLTGLCTAYSHGNRATHGKSLASPAFQALVAAAGGESGVTAYCQTLLGQPTVQPTQPTHPAKPVHPAKPARPTHPAKPTHPTKAGHPTKSH